MRLPIIHQKHTSYRQAISPWMRYGCVTLVLLFFVGVGQVMGGKRTIYLDVTYTSWWKNNDVVKVRAWGGTGGEEDVSMTIYEGNVLTCQINDDRTGLCFYRYYNNEWNEQTVDYAIGTQNRWELSGEGDKEWHDGKQKWKCFGPTDYAPNGGMVGGMNGWKAGTLNFVDNTLEIDLAASTTYNFKILQGSTMYSMNYEYHTFTSSTTDYTLYTNNNDCQITTAEAGTYVFKWYSGSNKIDIFYPNDYAKARLAKNTYLYVDTRNTNWASNGDAGYTARYFYKYYDSGTDVESRDCPKINALEKWVHYTLVPDNDYVGRVQIERKNPADVDAACWDRANTIQAFTRTSAAQNCISMSAATGDIWKNFDPVWSTYCPIKQTSTISDNGTVRYGGSGTEGDPYLVEKGTAIKLAASSTDHINDANMTTKYDFCLDDNSAQNTESATYQFPASETAGTTHKINVNAYNYYNNTRSTNMFSTLLFYRTVTCYTVTYNANGATGDLPASATKYKAGDNITVLGNTGSLSKSGYTFAGWNTAADGSGTHYDAGATISGIAADITLFAQWIRLTPPTASAAAEYYLGMPVPISLSATSKGLREPIVVFFVSDGTNTYQVTGAPYGSDGNSVGTIGAAGTEYTTVHKATFYATKAVTYNITAKLYEGKLIDNFDAEGLPVFWSGVGYGTCAKVTNIEREEVNGSNKVLKITRKSDSDSKIYNTAWTTTTAEGGTHTRWDSSYNYIHMRYYAPQEERPYVQYIDEPNEDDPDLSVYKYTELGPVSKDRWHKLSFAVDGGKVDLIYPFIQSGAGNSIYIDDVILSNEASMTEKITTGSTSVTLKKPFIIYRTGDKAGDSPRSEADDVETYGGGTIEKMIEYRMKVHARDTWYSLCLPFTVSAVKVWDAADTAYYDIVPYYRPVVGGTFYTGHYIIRTPKQTENFSLSEFGDWRDPASPTNYLPSPNTPYIIQWHDKYFEDKYISFFGDAGQTISGEFDAGSAPSADNVVNVYANKTMHSGTVTDAYLLENDYGSSGAWLRAESTGVGRTVLPFECFIRASEESTKKYRSLHRDMTIDDTTTGWADVVNGERKSSIAVYTLTGMLVAQYEDCSYNEVAHQLESANNAGMFILRSDSESVKLLIGGK